MKHRLYKLLTMGFIAIFSVGLCAFLLVKVFNKASSFHDTKHDFLRKLKDKIDE